MVVERGLPRRIGVPTKARIGHELFDLALFLVADYVPFETNAFRELWGTIQQSSSLRQDEPTRPSRHVNQMTPNLVTVGVN